MTPIRVLVLTEDGSSSAPATVQHLVRHALQRLAKDLDTRRLEWDGAAATSLAPSVAGTAWKNPRHRDAVTLRQSIATRLTMRDLVVVAVHIDGDRTWALRATSENAASFDSLVVERVRRLVAHRLGADDAAVAAAMSRLVLMMPYYSIEAWTYQNAARAAVRCRARGCGRHVGQFDAWGVDAGLLDEVSQVKNSVCLDSRDCLELVETGWPAQRVESAQKSFADTVARFRACRELVDALVEGS